MDVARTRKSPHPPVVEIAPDSDNKDAKHCGV